LEIPYRIVDIVSGAMNDAAAKKYDIEVILINNLQGLVPRIWGIQRTHVNF